MSRRSMLKSAGVGGVGLLLGASGIGGVLAATNSKTTKGKSINDVVPFYGEKQAGITTPAQNHVYFAALEVTASTREELVKLFKDWTKASAAMTEGKAVGEHSENQYLPPKDTGEAAGLAPSNLTITFGVGPGLFEKNGVDRFGLKNKRPDELSDLPSFPLDSLEAKWSGGDICIQACADDQQVAFHAVRNLVRIARGKAVIHWVQEGFQRTKQANTKQETPRNLFGFKDGTVNPDVNKNADMEKHVWVQAGDGPDWLTGGSYMVVRRIQMYIEVWDRSSLMDQEQTFGRHRDSGAPLGHKEEFEKADYSKKDANGELMIPSFSHMRVAHGDGNQQILRRAYSYTGGMDPQTGSFDAGLLFICFQRSPRKQFIPMQERLAKNDKLNEYTVHKGSAIFACLPGIKENGYIGEGLLS
ncbi:deferrochelatase/peroxidase EfeB [Bacillus sp. M6-12]|uniref:iron uptake transporter deferrochelatase/peroxidase subunit n=1 Tax=Bacillus sp. M6-12 TaxID=2054166 RepID=UPI000C77D4AF|nr:iron uptake transporter deferrochelatase/peroxidase subunit [Bacillus sp. M6-12]PLS16232.1 deferrochelatase/peroxidase EfeB [Bacillus sp. M6-12]